MNLFQAKTTRIGIHRRDYSQAMAGGKILTFAHAEPVLQGFEFVDPDRRRWATSRRAARGRRVAVTRPQRQPVASYGALADDWAVDIAITRELPPIRATGAYERPAQKQGE